MKSGPLHFILMAAAALSAFTLPRAASGARTQLAKFFVPVAVPTRAIGLWVQSRISPAPPVDLLSPGQPRNVDELRRQNAALIAQVQNLQAQVEDLKGHSAAYSNLEINLRRAVEPAQVIAGPRTNRQTLTINTSSLRAVRPGMAVVHPFGFVGWIDSVATVGGSATVLLVTDPTLRVQARFARLSPTEDGRVISTLLPIDPIAAGGNGKQIGAAMISAKQVRQHLRKGDVVLLDDNRFGPALKGVRIGVVSNIHIPQTNAEHASVEIDPNIDFGTMSEVLVVTK